MKKVLFIDRDGTLVIEPAADRQLDCFEKLEFYPGVFRYLSQIAAELDYELVMVTNQDGLGTTSFPEESFWPVHNLILKAFAGEGICFREVLIDRSFAADNLPTRKPGTGMLQQYLTGGYDLGNSFVIGDRLTDVALARNLGSHSIYMGPEPCADAALVSASWRDIYLFLKGNSRTATVCRKTAETDIAIRLNLDGSGAANIETGIGFFDHMLEQIARHGNLDLSVKARGDLEIDEHHTVEDVGLALGDAVAKALGAKKGIERYGFLLPMDDSLARVAIDFGGRPWLVWDAEFRRERIGDMPTEMFAHFFKSFSDQARCNLNIHATGTNEHHKIESIFKSFARALGMAARRNGTGSVPSTKGIL
jgi:imidazoleglycerol-phosphate dehydratase/histidinol-phosphatase